jgi:hypothetical protein
MAIVANAADQRPTRGWSSFVSEHDVLDASELRNAAGKGRTPALAADLEKEPDRLTDGETTSVQNILNCWEFLGCDGQRRANCPAYQKGKGKSCWLAAGSYCSDLKAAYGRDHVKTHCCDDCRYYQDRHKQVLKGVACP